jgi:hypothetical protein
VGFCLLVKFTNNSPQNKYSSSLSLEISREVILHGHSVLGMKGVQEIMQPRTVLCSATDRHSPSFCLMASNQRGFPPLGGSTF